MGDVVRDVLFGLKRCSIRGERDGPAGKPVGPSVCRWRSQVRERTAFTRFQYFAATIARMSRFADKISLRATLVIFVVGTIVSFAFGAMLTAVALHL